MRRLILALAAQAVAASAVADEAGWQERLLQAGRPRTPLQGVMLAPREQARAAVLVVPGSGPTDRDGNGPQGLRGSTYRLLAEGLAAKGVASLRIDKRGMFGSAKAVVDANQVTTKDYAEDVRVWAGVMRAETGARCIWLLGHSEGGLIALLAGRDDGICGLILVATPGRPLGRILRDQLKANPANAPLLAQALPAIEDLEAGKRVDTTDMHPALLPLFDPKVQGFLIDAFAVDPLRLLEGYPRPVLIVQGQRDLQITVADAEKLKQAAPQAKLVLLPDTNHILKVVETDDLAANIASYGDPSLPLAPGAIDAIADFVLGPASAPTRGDQKLPR